MTDGRFNITFADIPLKYLGIFTFSYAMPDVFGAPLNISITCEKIKIS